jgi:DHA2 family multidrug resistance protein-like MFS transporter
MIDLRLLEVPALSASLATYALATFVSLGMFVFVSQYLQLVLGLSPLHAGLWTMPFDAAFIVGSLLTPAIARRIRPKSVIAGGLTLAAVGFGVLAQAGGHTGVLVPTAGLVIYAFGLVPVFTLATDLIVGSAPPERAGVVSALSETGSELGGALGVAILGSLGTAVYRSVMATAVLHGIPADAAATARDTLEGAVVVAARLPHPLGTELLGAARGAFTQAMQWTGFTSAALALATAIASTILLRHVGTATEDHQGLEPREGLSATHAPACAVSGQLRPAPSTTE